MTKKYLVGLIVIIIALIGAPFLYYSHKNRERTIILPPAVVTQEKVSEANPNDAVVQNKSDKAPLSFTYVPNICKDGNSFECYQAHYQNLVKNNSVAAAFVDIKERYNEDAFVKASCHQLTHVIGRAAAAKHPKVSESYVEGDSFCWSGYYHGVVEAMVSKYGHDEFPKAMNHICDDIEGKNNYSFDYYNCVHGMGHASMVYTENEVFESLALCDNLSGNWEQTSCYGGVFMENIMVDNKNHTTKYLKTEDPVYPCNAVGEAYKWSCFMMQTSYMLKVNGGDFKKVFELCSTVEEGYRATCYQSVGRDASGQTISSVEPTTKICNLGENYEQRSNCVVGAVKDFISFYHSDTEAMKFCLNLPEDLQQVCKGTGEAYYASL